MGTANRKLRGQGAADYLLALGLIVALVLVLAIPVVREHELTVALSGARSSAWAYLSSDSRFTLDAVDYGISGNTVTIHPHVFLDNAPYSGDLSLRTAMISGVGGALAPASVIDYSNGCVSSVFNTYCVSVRP